jgi:carbonic anhydrase
MNKSLHPLIYHFKKRLKMPDATANFHTSTKDMTPVEALRILKEGNFRFINNMRYNRDFLERVNQTKNAQFPFAVILSCMDSRVPAEIIFDQGLGDIFSIRIAGNITSPGILGSLEYATAVAGAKLILVLGHTNCGAIKGACDDVQLGNLTNLLAHIRPAVELEQSVKTERNSNNTEFVQKVTELNVRHSVASILAESKIISDLVTDGKVLLTSGIYDVATGKVKFSDEDERTASATANKIPLTA